MTDDRATAPNDTDAGGEDGDDRDDGVADDRVADPEEGEDESLDERVAAVIDDLEGVVTRRDEGARLFSTGGRLFAAFGESGLDVWLDPVVARAALGTPDASQSARGPGWVSFTPTAIGTFALDRAEAWLRSAHRRALGASRGH